MNRNEMMGYLLTAVLGGAIGGHIGGLLGLLSVFAGLAIIGYVDLVAHLREGQKAH